MSLAAFLAAVIRILEDVQVPYMLTGSLASAFYAVPRATQDVDLVVDLEPAQLEQIVDRFRDAGF